jgi:hypothetical protein
MGQYPEEPVPLADLLRGRRGEEVPAAAGLLLPPGHVAPQQLLVAGERGAVVAARRGQLPGQHVGRDPDPGQDALERFERFWARVIDSFQASSQVWLATFDIFTVAQRDPEVRAAVAEGLEDGRRLWARLLYGVGDTDEEKVRAIGSLHQALVSGVLVQWLIDPGRAPHPLSSP